MLVVPAAQTLIAEARVAAHDIDQLRLGQSAVVRFSAFQRTTPELNGTVSRISADAVADPRTSASFYTVRISLTNEEISRLGEIRLIPGMPVEVFIQTGDRTVVAYLMKPLYDQIKRAFERDSAVNPGSWRSWRCDPSCPWPAPPGSDALGIEVRYLQVRDLRHSQARTVGDAEGGLVLEAIGGLQQEQHLLLVQHRR